MDFRTAVLWKVWYPLLTRMTRRTPITFLNYGYDDASRPPLAAGEEDDRACAQLYHRVVGAVGLGGERVLEVSCGHGGGASYVKRYLGPAEVVGVDRNVEAVSFCRRRHRVEGLSFTRGDAMSLPFGDGAFDAVVNVEASHCYPDVDRFFREVTRVLRPGGHFLYADFRSGHERPALHGRVARSGFEIVQREDISAGVLAGMRMNHRRYTALIDRVAPRPLRGLARRFAGVKGSVIYNELETGETEYFRYVLRKP
jgi:SAM-dependent methyltransferase